MSTKPTNDNDSTGPRPIQTTSLDRIVDPHSVIGTDARGRIHHYVKDYDREYMTEDGGAVYVIDDDGLEGGYELGEHSLTEWVEQVERATGWEECHVIGIRSSLSEAI